ncbi:hypothetical protein AB0M46_43845 [Dactylosporangium sp. NPDC051485]|uniref:hypothetical protein n=1 Tax=Dactylosporangium sp. NPDC051485 TaxID=3154846 RepID=UPI00341407DA
MLYPSMVIGRAGASGNAGNAVDGAVVRRDHRPADDNEISMIFCDTRCMSIDDLL